MGNLICFRLFHFFIFLFLCPNFAADVPIPVPITSPSSLSSPISSPNHSIESDYSGECNALLRFSDSFTITENASFHCETSYPRTTFWKKGGSDCCWWDGVTCDHATRHVIGLDLTCSWLRGNIESDSALFSLSALQRLNLAYNDFNRSQIPSRFGIFKEMTHLNLSRSQFTGQVPLDHMLSHLPGLISLDLSHSMRYLNMENGGHLGMVLRNLTKLRDLVLDGVDMSNIDPMSFTNLSSTLTTLSLSSCNLVGTFPNDIFNLPNLHTLDLSSNFGIEGTLGTMTNWSSPLFYLDLSRTNFQGPIPASIGNLTSLNHLDHSGSNFEGPIPPTFVKLAHHLVWLDLSYNNYSGTVDLLFDGNCSMPRLQYLSLEGCDLTRFPDFLSSSPEPIHLSLWDNNITGSIPEWIWRVGRNTLEVLDLSWNNFFGEIPTSICQMHSLTNIDLSSNALSSTLPTCLGNLSSLVELYLNNNFLYGPLPRSLSNCTSLSALNLLSNKMTGQIPEWIWRIGTDTLTTLDLSSNNFTGEIQPSICQMHSLGLLHLQNNALDGTLPTCLGNVSSLGILDISNNLLHGPLPRSLSNSTSLTSLLLESNELHGSINEITLPNQLMTLDLSNNQFSGGIPHNYFYNFSSLEFINLSKNNFISTIPQSLLINSNLRYLNLQANMFHGLVPEIPLPSQLDTLIISDNIFEGPLPIPPPTIRFYLTSNNMLTGGIPKQICNATMLFVIDLSNNYLTGFIPQCFSNFSAILTVLDLRANMFVGQMPDICYGGTTLETIKLSRNGMRGELPQSLVNCEYLEVLDVSGNEFEGHFPHWLDTLPNLKVLSLKSNKFYGPVGSSARNNSPFLQLHILDLSENRFSGPLPVDYLANLTAMKTIEEMSGSIYMNSYASYYEDSIQIFMKGLEIKLKRILTLLLTIDFSSNFFYGEIPEAIGDLKALKGLNFSHNNLCGNIPSSLGNLTNLEWIDLSSNRLNGEIPKGLALLSSLGTLNLSNNRLVGRIPQSTQFDTFTSDSFDGNPGLCGHPLPKSCGNNAGRTPPSTSHEEEETDSGSWVEWKAVIMGYGCGLAFTMSTWYVMMETGRPWWLVGTIERWLLRIAEGKRLNWRTNRPSNNVHQRMLTRTRT